jgi:YHS domain-containing protein
MKDDSRIVKDPICGKDVDTLRARAVGIFGGVTHYFCSQECKAKYVDPRKEVPSTPPRETGERRQAFTPPAAVSRQPSATEDAKTEGSRAETAKTDNGEAPRYAHSRMRRVTGEVGTPVVQIDLSPNKKPEPAKTESADEDLAPARSGRGWAWVAIVMLILAGGVIFFTLKHR